MLSIGRTHHRQAICHCWAARVFDWAYVWVPVIGFSFGMHRWARNPRRSRWALHVVVGRCVVNRRVYPRQAVPGIEGYCGWSLTKEDERERAMKSWLALLRTGWASQGSSHLRVFRHIGVGILTPSCLLRRRHWDLHTFASFETSVLGSHSLPSPWWVALL
jgi:hypothetical protein